MADYVEVFDEGTDITMTASAAITGGQLVIVSGAGTVAASSAAADTWLGVATTDAVSGAKVGITTSGVQELTASGAVTAGAVVAAAASGQVATFGGTNYAQVVGIALTSAASGAKVRIKFTR